MTTETAKRKTTSSDNVDALEERGPSELDLLDLFDGGWLAKLVENTNIEIFVYLHILGTKK